MIVLTLKDDMIENSAEKGSLKKLIGDIEDEDAWKDFFLEPPSPALSIGITPLDYNNNACKEGSVLANVIPTVADLAFKTRHRLSAGDNYVAFH